MARNYDKAVCGIYRITCRANGKSYIGSSKHVDSRLSSHYTMLRSGTHHSKHMQNAWDKHGEDFFSHETLLLCSEENLSYYEHLTVNGLSPEFNSAPISWEDVDEGYNSELIEQAKESHRRARPQYAWRGKKMCLIEIAEKEGVDYELLSSRVLGQRWLVEDAVSRNKRVCKYILTYGGVTKPIEEWADELGCHTKRIQSRLVKGTPFPEVYDEISKANKRLSFSEFCRLGGVNHKTAKSRFNSGKSLMECLEGGVNG